MFSSLFIYTFHEGYSKHNSLLPCLHYHIERHLWAREEKNFMNKRARKWKKDTRQRKDRMFGIMDGFSMSVYIRILTCVHLWILEKQENIYKKLLVVVMTNTRAITNVVIWDEYHYFIFYATHMSCCNTPCVWIRF